MTLLAQAYAGTGEEIFVDKLDYLVEELGKCQRALDGREMGRVPGRSGRAVRLGDPHPNQYVLLPSGILDGVTDLTIAVSVNLTAAQTGARIFHFGTRSSSYLSLTAKDGAGPRFAITNLGSGNEQQITSSTEVPVASDRARGDARQPAPAGSTSTGSRPPAGRSPDPAALGESSQLDRTIPEHNDPFLSATVDDFRIYAGALDPARSRRSARTARRRRRRAHACVDRFEETAKPPSTFGQLL